MNIKSLAKRSSDRSGVFLVLVSTIALVTQGAMAVPPADDLPPNIAENLFVPNAGYLRSNKINYLLRQAETTSRDFVRPRHAALQGTRRAPVILLEFANVSRDFEASEYETLLFGRPSSATGPFQIQQTLTQYYLDISYNKLRVDGEVFGWYTLPEDDTYYENGAYGAGTPFGELLEFGLKEADTETDFGQFDNDGPDGRPNSGDDDGTVDTVFFVHPEKGAECDSDNLANIWSHSWHYSYPDYGHHGPFETNDKRLDKHGNPILNPDGTESHILVEDYVIQPALSCESTETTPEIVEIGVFCHEYGHALGLPDLYDRTPVNDADSEGIGYWGIMAAGSYGGNGKNSAIPDHMSAWSKLYLGWAITSTITESGKYLLEPVENRGLVYRINVPNTQNKEFFLIEYRSKDWRDSVRKVQFNWDQELPNSGVAIWHVDERVGAGEVDWPFAPHDKGQNDSPSIPPGHSNRIAPESKKHSLVSLEQADHKLDLEYNLCPGDKYDLWLTESEFGQGPVASSKAYDNTKTGILVTTKLDALDSHIDVRFPLEDPNAPVRSPALRRLPGPAAAAPIGANDSSTLSSPIERARDQINLATLSAIEQKVQASGWDSLTATDEAALAQAAPWDLEQAISPWALQEISQIIEGVRTLQYDLRIEPEAVEGNLVRQFLQQMEHEPEDVTITFSRDGTTAERMTNLQLLTTEDTYSEDAEKKLSDVSSPLRRLVGSDIALVQRDIIQASATGMAVEFQQMHEYVGTSLPVWGAGVKMYYDQDAGILSAVESSAFSPTTLNVTGRDSFTSTESALEQIGSLLNLGSNYGELLTECDLGIFPLGGNPGEARLSFRACMSAGENHDDIHVYLDAESGEILEIR